MTNTQRECNTEPLAGLLALGQRFCRGTCEDELFGQRDADHPWQPLTAPCRTNVKVTHTPTTLQGDHLRDLGLVLPAPGSSPRVVSIRPICAEHAETHTDTEDG